MTIATDWDLTWPRPVQSLTVGRRPFKDLYEDALYKKISQVAGGDVPNPTTKPILTHPAHWRPGDEVCFLPSDDTVLSDSQATGTGTSLDDDLDDSQKTTRIWQNCQQWVKVTKEDYDEFDKPGVAFSCERIGQKHLIV